MALRGAGRRGGGGPQRLAKGGEHLGVDGVGLGVLGPGTREVPRARGLDDAHGPIRRVQCSHHRGLVAAGGFEDDLDAGARRCGRLGFGQPFGPELMAVGQPQDAGVVFLGVVQTVGDAAQVQLESGLGNVEAGVEDGGGVVLTHACLMRAPARCPSASSGPAADRAALNQRFEFGAMDGKVAGSLTQHVPKDVCQRRARLLAITAAWDASPRGGLVFYHPLSQAAQRASPTYKRRFPNRRPALARSAKSSAARAPLPPPRQSCGRSAAEGRSAIRKSPLVCRRCSLRCL